MSTFPQIRPVELPDYRGIRLKAQAEQINAENLKQQQIQTQTAEQAQADQKAAQQAIAEAGGDLEKALPTLAGKVSPATYQKIQDAHLKTKKELQELDDKKFALHEKQTGQLLALTDEAAKLPPEQYAQMYPQIAARAKSIMPELQIDPAQPIPQQNIGQMTLGLQTQEQYLKREAERRQQAQADETARHNQALENKQPAELQELADFKKDWYAAKGLPQSARNDFAARADFYARKRTVNQSQRNEVAEAIDSAAQSLANGDLTRLKDIASLRGDQRLLIFNKAKKLNPNFSTSDIDRQIKMEDDVTNGKTSQSLQSFGTFLEHAGEASRVVNSIRESRSSVPYINKSINWWAKNMSGDPAYKQMVASLEPVRKEFEGFLLGGRALYGDDRKAAETILSDDSTVAQVQAALKQMGHTVKARFNEINFRYKKVRHKDLEDGISPEALEGAKQIGIDMGVGGGQAAAPGVEPEAVGPGGHTIVYRGGAWVDKQTGKPLK